MENHICTVCGKKIPDTRILAAAIPFVKYRKHISKATRTAIVEDLPETAVKHCSVECAKKAAWTKQNHKRSPLKTAIKTSPVKKTAKTKTK